MPLLSAKTYRAERGRALRWTALGALVLAVLVLWVLVYGARGVKGSWMRRNEARARETVGAINRALAAYHKKYEGYPGTLERLRGGEEGLPEMAPPEHARLLDSSLAHNRFERDGYRFRFEPGQPQQRWAATVQLYWSYRLTAEPVAPGGSGEWFYYSDQSGEVRGRRDQPAGPDDPRVK